jgi:hypothetical protein
MECKARVEVGSSLCAGTSGLVGEAVGTLGANPPRFARYPRGVDSAFGAREYGIAAGSLKRPQIRLIRLESETDGN